jgi:hypothetical protein
MVLGAFGDSFLFGSDLSDIQDKESVQWHYPSRLTYPALIAKKLAVTYYCTALPGQGNKVIADDIIRAVAQRGNDMLYIINWSWIDRFDYVDGKGRVNVAGWQSILPGDENDTAHFFYKNLHSEIDSKLSNLLYIHSALTCLLQNKCKFIMTYMDNLLFDTRYHCPPSIDYLQRAIQNHMQTYQGKNFLEWSKEQELAISESWHPLEESHQKAAEYWLPTVKTLLNTHAKEDYLHAFK